MTRVILITRGFDFFRLFLASGPSASYTTSSLKTKEQTMITLLALTAAQLAALAGAILLFGIGNRRLKQSIKRMDATLTRYGY